MPEIDFRSMIVVWFKYKLRALGVLAALVGAAVAACLVMQTQYTSTATLLVKLGRELIYRPEVGTTQAALPTLDADNLIATNIAILNSPAIAQQVIGEVGLRTLYPRLFPDPDEPLVKAWLENGIAAVRTTLGIPEETIGTRALELFGRRLSVTPVKKTDLVAVSFMHPDPGVAARVANRVVELFQQKTGAIYANPNLAAVERMVAGEQDALQAAQKALNDYRQTYAVYALDEQMDLLLKQRMDLDSNLKAADAHVAELGGMIAVLARQRSATPQSVRMYTDTERHRSTDDTQSQVVALQLRERQLASRYNDDFLPLVEVRAQLKTAQVALASAQRDGGAVSRTGQNDTWQQLDQDTMHREAELQSTVSRREATQGQVAQVDGAMAELSSRQRTLQQLEQEVSLRTVSVKASFDKLADARAVDSLNREKPASFSLVEAAVPADPADPARPLPLLYTAAAAVAGLLLGLAAVFVSYRLSGTFVTAEQASRRLRLPVLAEIGYERRYDRSQQSYGRQLAG